MAMWQRFWSRFKRALWPDFEYWAVALVGAAIVGVILGVRALVQGL